MDNKLNQKIVTVSFAVLSAISGLVFHLLIGVFASSFGVVAKVSDSDFVRHILPVLVGLTVFAALQFNKKVVVWADQVVVELGKVVWPSRKDAFYTTGAVIVMVFISSIIVSVFDFLSGALLNKLMN